MKQFVKKPDLNAPRFRKQRESIDKLKLYRKFIKKHPEHKDCSYTEFTAMIRDFNESVWSTAISFRDGVELPENLGNIFIGTCKPSTRRGNINPKLSGDHGQKLHNTNMITDSKVAKIFYTNYSQKYRFKNRALWSFTGHRDFTRATSQEYRKNWQRYVIVEPFTKVNNMYDRYKKIDFAKKIDAEKIESGYNEFDFED